MTPKRDGGATSRASVLPGEPLQLRVPEATAQRDLAEHERRGLALIEGTADVKSRGAFEQWRTQRREWVMQGEILLRAIADSDGPATEFRRAATRSRLSGKHGWEADLQGGVDMLVQAVTTLAGYATQVSDKSPTSNGAVVKPTGSIFIAHGSDEALMTDVARLLEKTQSADYKVTILSEQPNRGEALIEKFEREAKAAAFAIVILSADDVGGPKSAKSSNKQKSRARQNVVFELGYFFACLDRRRVIALYERGVELPSDIYGLVYIEVSKDGQWRSRVIKELRDAGLHFDANSI